MILAIIAVITVPIILNIINNSKRGATIDSAYGYRDAINKWYVSKLTENPNYVLNDGTYSVSELEVTVEGKQPGSNSWVTISKTNVTDGCLQFDEYKVEITNGKVREASIGECEQRDTSIKIVSGTKGNLQLGDVIRIGNTEDFYVISSDSSEGGKTVLLAKYNLNVGYDVTLVQRNGIPPSLITTAIPTPEQVKQDSEFGGCPDSNCNSYKAAFFSEIGHTGYWMDTTTNPISLKIEYSNNGKYAYIYNYNNNYTSWFYDEDYNVVFPYVYDSNCEIYMYVNGENGYLDYLKNNGAPSNITGRLITYEEAASSGCVMDGYGSGTCTGFISETSFYIGSVMSEDTTMEIRSNGHLDRTGNPQGIRAGIRPVIEIYTSDI